MSPFFDGYRAHDGRHASSAVRVDEDAIRILRKTFPEGAADLGLLHKPIVAPCKDTRLRGLCANNSELIHLPRLLSESI